MLEGHRDGRRPVLHLIEAREAFERPEPEALPLEPLAEVPLGDPSGSDTEHRWLRPARRRQKVVPIPDDLLVSGQVDRALTGSAGSPTGIRSISVARPPLVTKPVSSTRVSSR